MPTVITHAVVPLAVGLGLGERVISRRLLAAGVIAAMLPDLDTVGLRFGIPYGSQFGHRGMTHSLAFAAVIGILAVVAHRQLRSSRWRAFLFVAFATASHGLLDAFTTGGKGVALLWPFSTIRFFAPWRVIQVSPIGVGRFFRHGAMQVVSSEFLCVWAPMVLVPSSLHVSREAG
jgi:inner membrane protein